MSKKDYPQRLRRIVARVEVDGKEVEMFFITNNLSWASSSVCDLYQSRWAICVFFKQIKQTLQICDFLGHPNKLYVGNSGRLYCCTCYCVFRHGSPVGLIALRVCLR